MGKSNFKKAIRARMTRTGENYTEARAALLLERAPKFDKVSRQDAWRARTMANWTLRMAEAGVLNERREYETTEASMAASLLARVARWGSDSAIWSNGESKVVDNHIFFPSGGGLDLLGAFEGNGGIYLECGSSTLEWLTLDRLVVRSAKVPGFDIILVDCAPEPSPHQFPADSRGRNLCVRGANGEVRPLREWENPDELSDGDRLVLRYDGGRFLICPKGSSYNISVDGLSPIYGNASHGGRRFDAYSAPHSHLPRKRFLDDLSKVEEAIVRAEVELGLNREVEARMYFCRNGLPYPARELQ